MMGVLDLVLEEETAITISDALPMYDAVGMIQEDVFVCRLVNKTSNPTHYVLKISKIETAYNYDRIKYNIDTNKCVQRALCQRQRPSVYNIPTDGSAARLSIYLKQNVVIASNNKCNGTYEYKYSIELGS